MGRYLVTGGGGFIGAAVVKALAERGDTIVALDIVATPVLRDLCDRHTGITFAPGELTEWPTVAEAVKSSRPDAIIHCAAIVGVLNSLASPLATMRVNVEGSLNVLSAMRLFSVPRMINLSTEEVYGPFRADRVDENHPCFPSKPYGLSKFAVEQLGRDFAAEHGLCMINVRPCWVYGPGLSRPRIPKTLVDAAVEGRAFRLATGADFRVDQVYIDDVVQGVVKALDHRDHPYDAYNIATGEAPSLGEIAQIVRELVPGADIEIGPGMYDLTAGVAPVRKGALDIGRARQAFGYSPQFPIREGLDAYIEWRRRQPT